MPILRHGNVITSATRPLARSVLGIVLCALSATAAADWRRDAVDTLTRESEGHRLVVLGEMHGTRELPLLAGDLLERWSAASPVLLALEIPTREHEALRAAVASGGTDATIEALRRRAWWQVPPAENDGRRSEDVLALVRRVGRLQASGRDVALLPFDPRDIRCYQRGDCEAAMAHVLQRAHDALPHGRIVVVTGNVHAMRARPPGAPERFPEQPMTALLQDLSPYSVNVTSARGAFWACGETCGTVDVAPSRHGGRERQGSPFDYRLVLPMFTPIRQVGQPAR
ncbi:calcium-binding protein [Luteimonas deserti]|uniref:Calcium-binding protein n=1 Tax=Luteimonas deserti TaxID=2752306 RepID=A0A7Z0QSX8_9GAMM|nr:calcium-binding protein [Luteimonas deserti]NYZ64316.1 calcium-binding protein [Luteimonas deserti]